MFDRISRDALYSLVWSKPLSQLGPLFGISDTGLRKKCKKLSIPLPHLGHWAKKAANKPIHQTPLTPRAPGASQYIEIETNQYRNHYTREILLNSPFPPPPDFHESIDSVHEKSIKNVGTIPYPRLTLKPHPLISKLLNDDIQRIKEARETRYSWVKPRFDTALQKRKLRLINALFLGANKVSGKPYININKHDEDIQSVSIQFGECSVSININPVITKATIKGKKVEQTHFKLSLGGYSRFDMEEPYWEDSEEQKIENSLSDIIVEMLVGAEKKYRAHEQWQYAYYFERRQDYINEDIERQREEERLIREEAEREQQAKIDELLHQANNLQKAQTIRHYVAAIQSSQHLSSQQSDINNWAKWALEQADTLDPIKQSAFMKQIVNHDNNEKM